MNILSLQSEVVYGHVGQGAARFALQRLGHEVWALPTVLLSSHAGYRGVTGEVIAADRMRVLLDGLSAIGCLSSCAAVLSGYLGSAEQVGVVADAVSRVKGANAGAIYCLDPVLGDEGRAYARAGIAEAMARHLLPLSDIVTPNAFELVQLSGLPVRDPGEASAAARRLGRSLVAATSVPDGPTRIGVLGAAVDGHWFASTSRLDMVPHGAGDLFAALLVAGRLGELSLTELLQRSTSAVFHVLAASRGLDELRLIGEQHLLADPPPAAKLERID